MVLIDGNNLLYKDYFSYKGADYKQLKDFFIRHLHSLASSGIHDLVVIWDSAFGSWRNIAYPSYKGTRTMSLFECDSEAKKFYHWRIKLRQFLYTRTSIRQTHINRFEADDIIALYVRNRIKKKIDVNITIVSNDKDFYQLLHSYRPTVNILRVGRNKQRVLTREDFEEEYEIRPALWSDVRALSGDTSDNIPGIEGIGPVRAVEIIKTYGPLKKWINSVAPNDKIKISKWAFKARLKRKKVMFYYKLVDLKRNHSGLRLELSNNTYK